ncbi:hypothetical protein C206_01040 [Pseudomonas putida TRO1]|jgi:hypothetical protein|uniref:Uncharacterized protein n=1 Tax=Pseudomonas putida TRO1 TaxID=1227924 RepID=A0AAD2WG07_PSEPU|nr:MULTISPECIES: hypothetical protein [Pseudomonas]ELS0923535.1 hypothetical protein [Pseudomonas putida]ENY79701.1 hypothetical protein C206_01040 [Pseudomonas putida TRO1]MBH3350361.1 hypothetical protein [Pseudomonas putida]UWH21121.1 hypothetical protein KW568_19145 [Pseudomonas sp. HD6515]HDS0941370.1 hypothetical protein [Pseudomonas putida]
MFRSHQADMAGIPGMFGDGLMHWHCVSRALATHWYHVSVQRLLDGQLRDCVEMPNDEARLVELLLAQDESLIVREVQAVTPGWMNGDGWKMEKLMSLSMGFSREEVPVSILEVEGGKVYIDSHEPGLNVESLAGLKELYRRSPVKAASAEMAGA